MSSYKNGEHGKDHKEREFDIRVIMQLLVVNFYFIKYSSIQKHV